MHHLTSDAKCKGCQKKPQSVIEVKDTRMQLKKKKIKIDIKQSMRYEMPKFKIEVGSDTVLGEASEVAYRAGSCLYVNFGILVIMAKL